jgi:hypothetical protein
MEIEATPTPLPTLPPTPENSVALDHYMVTTTFAFDGYTADTFTTDEVDALKEAVVEFFATSSQASGDFSLTTDQVIIGEPNPGGKRRALVGANGITVDVTIKTYSSGFADETATALTAISQDNGESSRLASIIETKLADRGRSPPANAHLIVTNTGVDDTSSVPKATNAPTMGDISSDRTEPYGVEDAKDKSLLIGVTLASGGTICCLALILAAKRYFKHAKNCELPVLNVDNDAAMVQQASGMPAVPDVL